MILPYTSIPYQFKRLYFNIIVEGIITRRESKKTEAGETFTQIRRAIKGEDIDSSVDTESINDMDKLAVFILENRLTSGTLSIVNNSVPTQSTIIKRNGDLIK